MVGIATRVSIELHANDGVPARWMTMYGHKLQRVELEYQIISYAVVMIDKLDPKATQQC